GRGLGKAALAYALNRLAQWHERCYLVTTSARTGAIALYLNFGFEPDLTPPGAGAVWREIATRLAHPALAGYLAKFAS
ncbi:MAG: GNAT family N-acetyltransferase, partial [Lentisphaerae bacterium]|nr:GNAT family N-acetyltransferase [Lentisphaerota bacterium]